jgi:hypothetical protein
MSRIIMDRKAESLWMKNKINIDDKQNESNWTKYVESIYTYLW